MAVGSFMKSSGLAAMAAALAMLAFPASAQDRSQGRWGGRGGAEASAQGNGGSWRGNGGGARRSEAARAPQPQAQPQRQRNVSGGEANAARANRGVERGSEWRGRGNVDRGQARVQAVPQAPVRNQAERRVWGGDRNGSRRSETWQGGNRNYADANRNAARIRQEAARERADNSNRWRNQNSGVNRGNTNWNRNAWNGNNNWNTNNNNWRGNRLGYAQRWDRNWRRDNRFDWQGYRSSNRGIYQMSPYYAPYRDYRYRRLSAGFQLNSLFFGSQYLINDPWQYRLPPADGPFRWVRYYDDALLVDTYSGEVVDVIYDFFW
jgi:hypothetical protein